RIQLHAGNAVHHAPPHAAVAVEVAVHTAAVRDTRRHRLEDRRPAVGGATRLDGTAAGRRSRWEGSARGGSAESWRPDRHRGRTRFHWRIARPETARLRYRERP